MINLLPPAQKEILAQEKKKRMIIVLGFICLTFFISLSLVFLSVELYIAGHVKAQEIILEQKEKEFRGAEIKELEEEIKLSNEGFLRLKSFYEKRISFVEILEKIYSTLPLEVYLNQFSYSGDKVALSGYAPTRLLLLEFRENLINKKEFKNIVFPGEPWIQPANIDFYVTFEIDEGEINN